MWPHVLWSQATCYAVSEKENRALFGGCKQNQNDRNTWTMDSLSCTVGKCPPRLTMPNSSAQWSPTSCYEGSTDVKKKKSPLTNLACFSAFFAAFSASFCCFFRPFFDWACSASAALKQEEAHNINISVNFHLLFLPHPMRKLLTAWEN